MPIVAKRTHALRALLLVKCLKIKLGPNVMSSGTKARRNTRVAIILCQSTRWLLSGGLEVGTWPVWGMKT